MNRIQDMLDTWGLPWRDLRRDLAARFGVHPCPWMDNMDLVLVPMEREALPGLLRPLSYWDRPQEDPGLPPLSFSGELWVSGDALGNLDVARRAVEPHLGKGEKDDTANTRGWCWREGAAQVRIIGWPPALQFAFGPNTRHEREPRLITACSIEIETGHRIACSAEEEGWLEAFVPALTLPVPPLSQWFGPHQPARGWLDRLLGREEAAPLPDAVARMAAQRVSATEQAYVRLPPADVARLHGKLGLSPDGSTLIWCAGKLKIVPLANIKGVHLEKIAPAKGGGGNHLELRCQRDAAAPEVACFVMETRASQPLDDVAEALAALVNRPLSIGHSSDC